MKTMSDFQGTQGDFLQSGALVYALQEEESRHKNVKPILTNRFTASVEGTKVPNQELIANAKLFANSKKVLAKLIDVRNKLAFDYQSMERDWDYDLEEIDKLINDSL